MPDSNENRPLVVQLLVVAVGAFVFGVFLLPPLYDVFCEITGFGGRTNTETVAVVEAPDLTREVRIEFNTTLNSYAQFEFTSDADSMTVHPGKMYYATFTARNLTEQNKVAQAVPSVSPVSAADHFIKIECFCFTSQEFLAGEKRVMPLQFIVDPDLPEFVDTITLQYTYFDTTSVAANDR